MSKQTKPSYLHHKATGQARCRINGRDHYLGPYGSPESREKYEALVAEWFARNGDTSRITLTVDDLAILFMEFAEGYYRRPNGEPTGAAANIRLALRPLVRLFGSTRIHDFGPMKLKVVRDSMIEAGHCRKHINSEIHRIKRVFKWGVENELLTATIYQALLAVASLKCGRSEAVESTPVEPVADETVKATLPHLPTVVAAMVRLQLLTGARPGEICLLRPCDVTIQPTVFVFRPERHKTEHHGRERRIFIGPEGQAVLRPFLDRDSEAYCFSPAESEAERNAERKANRKSPMTPSQAARRPKTDRQRAPRTRYDKNGYGRAIVRACLIAGVESWSPNQLRHTRATAIRERYGLEAAATVLGHSDTKITAVYAERDFVMAARIMAEVG